MAKLASGEISKWRILQLVNLANGEFIFYRYDGSTGLLQSKMDHSGSYLYQYDTYGRLFKAVLPTGEAIGLQFNLTSQGAAIDVLKNEVISQVVLVQDHLISKRPWASDPRRHVISVSSDKTITSRQPNGLGLTLATIPHPVIGLNSHEDSVMADSFPMAGELRTFMGTNLISTLAWKYSLATRGSSAASLIGISKTLVVNNEELLTVYYDKLQKRQVLYSLTSSGKEQLLEVRYDSLSRPLAFDPRGNFAALEQTYDIYGNLESWTFEDLNEAYKYDQAGRLINIERGNESLLAFAYKDSFDVLPRVIGLGGNKSQYRLTYQDTYGGLSKIQTPRGHFHSFKIKADLGLLRFQYRAPWLQEESLAFEVMYNGQGQILRKRMPSKGGEAVTFTYDLNDNLKKVMAGETESELGYDAASGLLESVVTRCGHHFDMRMRLKYHGGLMKEMKVRFSGSSSPDFDNAVFRYQYDGNGRLAVMLSSIGALDHQATDTFAYNAHTGRTEGFSGFRVNVLSHNKSMITDSEDNFYKTIEFDGLGRLKKVAVGLQRKQMLAYDLQYDSRGYLKAKSSKNHEGRPSQENYSYTTSGELSKIWGPDNFEFGHDENGNLVRIKGANGEEMATFDLGDRVESINSNLEDVKVTYDPVSGCVSSVNSEKKSRRFWHDSRGKLVQMASVDLINNVNNHRTSYQYDFKGRLTALNTSRNNRDKTVLQFFYADPRHPDRVTHVQSPRIGLTQRLIYDTQNHLVSIETKDQKLYVATDNLGSPVLIFRPDGTIDKELKYSAFGQVLSDSSPAMNLPVGYKGGLIVGPGLVLLGQRIYDVTIRQWLNPEWEHLQQELTNPLDIFVYRFKYNNPLNEDMLTYAQVSSMTFWSKLYGYDISLIMPNHVMTYQESQDSPPPRFIDFKLNSGLMQAMASGLDRLRQISFIELPQAKERLVFNSKLACESTFNQGLLLTPQSENQLINANVIDGAVGVVPAIFLSVLNGTKYLDEISYINSAQQSVYFFAKRTGTSSDIAEALMASDVEAVNRLSGQFNVQVSPLNPRGKELKIDNKDLVLHVLYSDSASIANYIEAVLAEASEEAMSSAWMRERNLVQAGFTGYGDWTQNRIAELLAIRPGGLKNQGVRGYEAVEIQPHGKYPHLVRDQSNYGFVSETLQQRRRKNRHGKSRKYA